MLGHYLMDHLWVAGGASGEFPEIAGKATMGGPQRPDGFYVIRFRNTKNKNTTSSCAATDSRAAVSTSFNWRAPGFGAGVQEGAARIPSSAWAWPGSANACRASTTSWRSIAGQP